MLNKPSWWPTCPYPESIFPSTVDDYASAIPDPRQRTAISGVLGREFWNIASEGIWRAYRAALEDGDIEAELAELNDVDTEEKP